MKNKFIIFFALIFVIIPGFAFFGCAKNSDKSSNQTTFYYDQTDIDISGISLSISLSEYTLDNVNLTIRISAFNTQTQDKIFSLNNAKVVNERTNVGYDEEYNNIPGGTTMKYNIVNNIESHYIIPSSYTSEHYYLLFETNGKSYCIKLYEMPDSLRADHTISFKVYSYPNYININEKLSVKDNRTSDSFAWEDNNHKYYCNTWYIDEARTQAFNWSTKITGDMTLYGMKTPVVSTTYESPKTFITGIRYVPRDGKLVIDKFSGHIALSNYALYNNSSVKEIFLPKELERIYFGNFDNMSSLTKIHFEGSEAEWNAIESSSTVPSSVTLIFNSSF